MGWFIPLAIATGATGLGMQMKGQYEAGKAAERQAKTQANMLEYQAKLQEREAEEKQVAAAEEERKHRKAGERLKARQRATAGKVGVLPVGSIAEVFEETETELERDALLIRRGGQVGAQYSRTEAQFSRMRGQSALFRGTAARRAGRMGAFGSGLTGASQLMYMSTQL